MSVNRPYRRSYRQFVDDHYTEGGRSQYIVHSKFAQSPKNYIRGFLLLQNDLQELFDYIEPSDQNLECFSYRIHALLVRACIEVEANFKAILRENGYSRSCMNIKNDYYKINKTHLLSSYEVEVPYWKGQHKIRKPFSSWLSTNYNPLSWYQAYNNTKHDRHSNFEQANFENLIDACCGLLVLLSSQFGTEDFSPGSAFLALESSKDTIGSYFKVTFPENFPPELRYDFNWQDLKDQDDPFLECNY
ncbi:hypothetical protein [Dolichospermum compactum]|uniref:Uncharacterized protein n=1 Tax=Dolichospermum compactum NIES-806 TaxID=1973481 RepID=A0A1Z4V5I0_9CYAN|nr:hypothetical protein [Dolichospermum compactum]BAZ86515.1 hypothetical protein NIES806_27280 [Dolichospermum compactum NIES-806]